MRLSIISIWLNPTGLVDHNTLITPINIILVSTNGPLYLDGFFLLTMVSIRSCHYRKQWQIFVRDGEHTQGIFSSQHDIFYIQGPTRIWAVDHLVKGYKSLPLVSTSFHSLGVITTLTLVLSTLTTGWPSLIIIYIPTNIWFQSLPTNSS